MAATTSDPSTDTYAIFVGRWTDYSSQSPDQLTLPTRAAAILIAGIATFIGIVGAQFWSITAFVVHQCRASPTVHDGLHHFQQMCFRNSGSAVGSAWLMFKGSFPYAGRKSWWLWSRHPTAYPSTKNPVRRTTLAILLPLMVAVFFAAAGPASGLITRPVWKSNDVKALSDACGFTEWNTATTEGALGFEQHTIQSAMDGLAYATRCYNSADSISCSAMPQQKLDYAVRPQLSCPFGERCKGTTMQLSTRWLDSHHHFGINAPSEDRVQVRKNATCAVLNVDDLVNVVSLRSGQTAHQYLLGPVPGVSTFTTFTLDRESFDYVGYTIQPFYAFAGVPETNNPWIPIDDLWSGDGDLSLFNVQFGSIQYQTSVQDILFSANNETDGLYLPDDVSGFVACVDRWQFRNSDGSSQTRMHGLHQAWQEFETSNSSASQLAAGLRLYSVAMSAEMYNAVNGLGTAAIRAQRRVFATISTGLPADHWQQEVKGWFETTLAMMQRGVVAFALKTRRDDSNSLRLRTSFQTSMGLNLTTNLESMCNQQKLRNIANYQTISMQGIFLIAGIGGSIIVLSLCLESLWAGLCWVIGRCKGGETANPRLWEWKADSSAQLQRYAYQSRGRGEWQRCADDIPIALGDFHSVGDEETSVAADAKMEEVPILA